MHNPSFTFLTPGLLVSVRNATEALIALDAGANVIDVKEPDRGALGAADYETVAEIARVVGGRVTVTAAMGELINFNVARERSGQQLVPAGVSLFKLGLAGCGLISDWRSRWQNAVTILAGRDSPTAPRPVAVAYADWRAAGAPTPIDVLEAGVELGCPALLIDTYDKSSGTLFDHFPEHELRALLDRAHAQRLAVVLAGSLTGENFARAAALKPDLVAVRGAACDRGRDSSVSREKIRGLIQALAMFGDRARLCQPVT